MWRCPNCSEHIEDQFDSCWKCAATEQSPAPKQDSVLAWMYPALSFFLALGLIGIMGFFEHSPRHGGPSYYGFAGAFLGVAMMSVGIWAFLSCPMRHWFAKILTLLLMIFEIAGGLFAVASFVSHLI
jgi:hypothetical protein